MEKIMEKWRKTRDEQVVTVNAEDIMTIVSKWTGVPLTSMEEAETARLLHMEEELEKTVIGQHEAVVAISKALRRSRADLKDPKRPIGSFIFLGPTGVGKTLLAKALAEFMFNSKDALIQIDMSEYMEKFSVSRLVGSPPGYVGHEEGGQLTEKVRRRPYSVVLFDEAEKAHPDLMHILLQILEEGKLTDSQGRSVDFRNTIIILTSNLGADMVKKGAGLGFGDGSAVADYDGMKNRMTEDAKRAFRPELLNRIDEMIVFRQLTREDVTQVLDLEVEKIKQRLAAKKIEISLTESARAFLIDKGFDVALGARPMRRSVERYLEDPLAEEILKGTINNAEVVEVTAGDGRLKFQQLAGTS
jgi:ATP-dependent Clp protease ATP-binding subunit ClpC